MKHSFFATFMLFVAILGATSIDLTTAEKVASERAHNFYGNYTISNHHALFSHDSGLTLAYVFELEPKGYVVVSGNRDLPPIIAYSTKGYFGENNDKNTLQSMLIADLIMRTNAVNSLPQSIIDQRHISWDHYLAGTFFDTHRVLQQWPPEGTTETDGWVETMWNQDAPYNALCPLDPLTSTRSYAGCPAIAMAQILNFHHTTQTTRFDDSDDYYHNMGSGRRYWIDNNCEDYDFPSFPQLNEYLDTLDAHYSLGITITNMDKAALIFACAVASTQVFSSEGSGTFGVAQANNAYLRFGFGEVLLLTDADTDIYDVMIDNVQHGFPFHLAVVDPAWSSGHNFVVDGYNTDGFYHVNFGWGGMYDGWYSLPDEIPYGLTVIEGALLNIFPDPTIVKSLPKPTQLTVNIFPNPFNSTCYISAPNASRVEICDLTGKLVQVLPTNCGIWHPDANICAGAYLVRVIEPNGTAKCLSTLLLK